MFNFWKFFFEKRDFSGKQNVDIFEKQSHFLILWIGLENETSLAFGVLRFPRIPCGEGAGVIAFKRPGRSPRNNTGDASVHKGFDIPIGTLDFVKEIMRKDWRISQQSSVIRYSETRRVTNLVCCTPACRTKQVGSTLKYYTFQHD